MPSLARIVLPLVVAMPIVAAAQQTRAARLPLVDPFDGVALGPAWSVLNPTRATVAVSGGARLLGADQRRGDDERQDEAGETGHESAPPGPRCYSRARLRVTRYGGVLARVPPQSPRRTATVVPGASTTSARASRPSGRRATSS